jgi:tRNA1(Val) A37 N6-methylase TrmN6
LLAKYNLPVKRARLVQPDQDKEPNLILAEGVKNSSQGIKWLPSLCIYENGQYTKELKEIYGIE